MPVVQTVGPLTERRPGPPPTASDAGLARFGALPAPQLEWNAEVERATAHLYERIKNVVPLKSGAIIRLGDSVRLAFEEARPDEAETRGLATEPKEAALHTIRPMFAPPLEAPGEPAPMTGPATLEPEAALASVPRRPRRKGLRLPIFSKPWMLILVILLSSGLCMAVFLFFVDVFNLWCSWFSWALSACS